MFIRITRGTLKPDSWDDYETAYRELVANAEPVEGLRGRLLARDAEERDAGYSISFWDGEDALRAYEDGDLRQRVLPELEPFFTGEFSTRHCEVTFEQGEFGQQP